jgi:hypothetical protein
MMVGRKMRSLGIKNGKVSGVTYVKPRKWSIRVFDRQISLVLGEIGRLNTDEKARRGEDDDTRVRLKGGTRPQHILGCFGDTRVSRKDLGEQYRI